MSRSVSSRTARSTAVAGRTSATSGTATVVTTDSIDGIGVDLFDELVAYLDATALAGTTPTMDIYLQRAIRTNADPTVDSDWEDFYHFPQVTTGAVLLVVNIPAVKTVGSDALTTAGHARVLETLAADSLRPGHWGDKLRVREKIGGTVSTPSTWSLYLTGLRKGEPVR